MEKLNQSSQDNTNNRIKVLIVDDHPLVRNGIRLFLSHQPQLQVVGEAANGEDAIQMASKLQPDIVLLDIKMPGTDGFEVAEWLEGNLPAARVVMLSMYRDTAYVVKAIECGARGFVRKDGPLSTLLVALESVHSGRNYFPAGLTGVTRQAAMA